MRNFLRVSVFFFSSLFIFISSCKHDSVLPEAYHTNEPIFTGECNSDTIYYDRDVTPILNANCATSNCHNSASSQDGVDLSSYTQVIKTGGVIPFNAEGSELIEVLYNSGSKQMPPPPSNHLPNEAINVLEKWITQGAYNFSCEDTSGRCNTSNMSYSNDIVPILLASCVGCHSAPSPAGGVDLSTYANVKVQVHNGMLLGTINYAPGFVPMPEGAKLDDCSIDKISSWVADGAQNN